MAKQTLATPVWLHPRVLRCSSMIFPMLTNEQILFGTIDYFAVWSIKKGRDNQINTKRGKTLSSQSQLCALLLLSDWLLTWREIFQVVKRKSMENQANWKSLFMLIIYSFILLFFHSGSWN